MNIPTLVSKGLPVPESLILSQAVVDDTGRLYAGVGWGFSDGLQFGVWGKFRPANRSIADGLAGIINGIREQTGPNDDTPRVLTLSEVAEVLLGTALGKH